MTLDLVQRTFNVSRHACGWMHDERRCCTAVQQAIGSSAGADIHKGTPLYEQILRRGANEYSPQSETRAAGFACTGSPEPTQYHEVRLRPNSVAPLHPPPLSLSPRTPHSCRAFPGPTVPLNTAHIPCTPFACHPFSTFLVTHKCLSHTFYEGSLTTEIPLPSFEAVLQQFVPICYEGIRLL